jgi:hypothetical protein
MNTDLNSTFDIPSSTLRGRKTFVLPLYVMTR